VFDVLIVLIVKEVRVFVFIHVGLWWLVGVMDTQCFHLASKALFLQLLLFLSLEPCFLLLLKFFCFLLLVLLDAAEFIEDVLVVKQGVREFFLEDFTLKEALDSLLNGWNFKELMDGRSLSWVSSEHHAYELGDIA